MTTYTAPRSANPLLAGTDPLASLLSLPPFGGEGGYNDSGDALPRVTETADGVDLNTIWTEMQQALDKWNSSRSAIADLLSYWHTSAADAVPQGLNEQSFEEASEYGEPEGLRPPAEHALLGYTLKDFDRAARLTWRALRDMDARQVRAVHDGAMNSDNRLVTGTILQRLFDPAPEENATGHTCYGLWSGDGTVPPLWNGRTFQGTHTHYKTTGAVDVDSEDLLEALKDIREHGYGVVDSGQEIIALVSERESEVIQSFRANVENNNTVVSKWDFLPASNQPSFILQGPGELVGNLPAGEIFGLPTVGKWGPVWIVETQFCPDGYFAIVATSGPGSTSNPIGVRQHTNKLYQGLRQLPGTENGYPLLSSFYSRTFGTGTRHRGAATVRQLAVGNTYTAPSIPR
ncbi:hypothetical protein [Mycolicibacterium llatzerense]|uniref:hypothetical protein n=1 Tax=Mycolicibacterium llatzerense TaxID=280871 RepID=UPI0021B58FEB|nr:hypothetical protein [Mycolicibacterium llatzerense]MCT7365928.1 hypothetical protein [Mycolicibacterium llatzerense]